METVLKELERMRTSPDADAVHDLRVAMRRCRAMAGAITEVDPHPAWNWMRKQAKKLFRQLGELRDTQVMKAWVEKLGPDRDALSRQLLASLQSSEQSEHLDALKAASAFDTKAWKELAKTLGKRMQIVAPGSLAAECLVLERYEDARALHARAMHTEKSKAWHELRMGVKKFRYAVEGLLPAHHEAWIGKLKRMQDLLGDVHDLDALEGLAASMEAGKALQKRWRERIAIERQSRIEKYLQMTAGGNGAWAEWRHGLPHGSRMLEASMARLDATAKAATRHRRKAAQVSRMALAVYRGLASLKAAPELSDAGTERVMRAAAGLHSAQSGESNRAAPKAARDFLKQLRVPPGWTPEEWQEVAAAVLYQGGKEPDERRGGYAKLSEAQRRTVCLTAGVLRLARALVKSGATRTSGIRMEKTEEAIVLKLAGLADTEESAARVSAAKHLLQTCIGRPILIVAMPARRAKLPSPPPEPPPALAFAAAGD